MADEIKIPQGWNGLQSNIQFIIDNLMVNNTRFVLDNWDYKYINLRVDMRSGSSLIKAGNLLPSKEVIQAEYLLDVLTAAKELIGDDTKGFDVAWDKLKTLVDKYEI